MVLTDIDTSDAPGRSRGSEVPGCGQPSCWSRTGSRRAGSPGPGPGGELFDRALTHRSYAYERGGLPTNERLEFLGDSVLGLVVTEHLFVSYPGPVGGPAGQAARRRGQLARAGRRRPRSRSRVGIHLGRGEESTGGRDKSSILADTMEAVIGAVFLQHGVEARRGSSCTDLFDALMADVATRGAGLDWKTSLQEIASLARPRRARLRGDRVRSRPRQDLRRHGRHRRPDVRSGCRPQQEGGGAEGGRARLRRHQAAELGAGSDIVDA